MGDITSDPIAILSDPDLIRECLARAVNEADILRRALRIAEKAAQAESERIERAKVALIDAMGGAAR